MNLLKKMFLLLFVVSFMLVSCDILEDANVDGDDTTAPTVTISSVTADDTDAEIVVEWSYDDAEDVAAVAVSITPADAETQTFTDDTTTATFTGLNSGTEYTVSIIATDAAGNASTAATGTATTFEEVEEPVDAEAEGTLWQLTTETYTFTDNTLTTDYVTEGSDDYTENPIYFILNEGVLTYYGYSDELETYIYQEMDYTLGETTITIDGEMELEWSITEDTIIFSETAIVDEEDEDNDSDVEETYDYEQVFIVADETVDLSEAINADDLEMEVGKSVQLTDTSDSSAGRIRFDADTAMTTGSVSANVMYPTGEDQTLYVTVYGDGGASSSHRIVDLIIDEGEAEVDGMVGFTVRDNTITSPDADFDTWIAVDISWDGTNATVTIDGTEVGSFTYLTPTETPTHVEFKYGTNSSIADDTDGNQLYAYVDDIVIIGNDVELVNENFDDLEVDSVIGYPFDDGDTVEAVVSDLEDATSELSVEIPIEETAANSVQLTDTSDSSAGRIRFDADTAMTTGSVSANVMYPTGEDQTLYVTVYGDGGASSSHRIVDLLIDEGEAEVDGMVGFKVRDNTITSPDADFDTWIAVDISWDGTDATVTIDGTEVGSFTYLTPTETPTHVEFKYGTNSSIADDADGNQLYAYVDDIVIIGNDVELVNENFDDLEVDSAIGYPFDDGDTVEAVVSDLEDATNL